MDHNNNHKQTAYAERFQAAVLDSQGKEIAITEAMILQACHELDGTATSAPRPQNPQPQGH